MSDDTPTLNDPLRDIEWVASVCLVKPSTVRNWVADPNHPMPKGFRLGSGTRAPRRWRESDIMGWLESLSTAA